MKVINRSGKSLHIPNYGRKEPGESWDLPDDMAARYLSSPSGNFGPESSARTSAPKSAAPVKPTADDTGKDSDDA